MISNAAGSSCFSSNIERSTETNSESSFRGTHMGVRLALDRLLVGREDGVGG